MINKQTSSVLKSVAFDEDDLIIDPRQWTEDIAIAIAEKEGIGPLGPAHWNAIHAIRDYYFRLHAPPPMSKICRDETTQAPCVQELFHTCLTAWKVSGLPNPGEEAKSYLSATR